MTGIWSESQSGSGNSDCVDDGNDLYAHFQWFATGVKSRAMLHYVLLRNTYGCMGNNTKVDSISIQLSWKYVQNSSLAFERFVQPSQPPMDPPLV